MPCCCEGLRRLKIHGNSNKHCKTNIKCILCKTEDNLVPDFSSRTVHNTDSPYGTIYWCYLEAAKFQDGHTLTIMHQGSNVTCNLTECRSSKTWWKLWQNVGSFTKLNSIWLSPFLDIGRHTTRTSFLVTWGQDVGTGMDSPTTTKYLLSRNSCITVALEEVHQMSCPLHSRPTGIASFWFVKFNMSFWFEWPLYFSLMGNSDTK
jgi:hypothetical protein